MDEHQQRVDLSREAWDAARVAHEERYRIPSHLTDEQVHRQFPAVASTALKTLVGLFINYARSKKRLPLIPVYRIKVPADIQELLGDAVNAATGGGASRSYSSLADEVLRELRKIEHTFLGHHD